MADKAYIPGYESDIFISYAHVDNETDFDDQDGWVDQFRKLLAVRLAKRFGRMDTIKIWWDDHLERGQLFDVTIEKAIKGSAIFLALTSPGYKSSQYCQKEIDCFYEKIYAGKDPAGLVVGSDRIRYVNCLLNNIPHKEWPEKFGDTTGFPFHDAGNSKDFGEPSDPRGELFRDQIRDLVDYLYNLIESFREELGSKSKSPQIESAPKTVDSEGIKLYFGDVPRTLRSRQRRVMLELEDAGFEIVETVLPEDVEDDKYRPAVEKALRESFLAIHLLDDEPGKPMGGEFGELTFPQCQVKVGLEHARSQYIWVPKALDLGAVSDPAHREFLEMLENQNLPEDRYTFIRSSPAIISEDVCEKIETIRRLQEEQQAREHAQRTAEALRIGAALLDTHIKDQGYALDLSEFLMEQDIRPYVVAQTDSSASSLEAFKKALGKTLERAGIPIIFFGDVNKEWVLERLGHAAQIAITQGWPLKECAVYLAPPKKEDIDFNLGFLKVHSLNNMDHFDPATFNLLLGGAA